MPHIRFLEKKGSRERKQRKEAAEKGNSRKTISRIKPERYKEKKEGRKKTLEKESRINKGSQHMFANFCLVRYNISMAGRP